jgi:uncharacterized protein (TIGR03083 family)
MSHLLSDDQVVAAYLELRHRVVQLLRTLDDEQVRLVVPACPNWTVAEVAAHIVGVPEDIVAGRMEGVTTEAWTQTQVERHRGASANELADRLERTAEAFDAILPHIPAPVNSQMVMDAVTHEFDLRSALGNGEYRESKAVEVAIGWLLESASAKNANLAASLSESDLGRYDLLRSLTGRRTLDQIAALGLDAKGIAQLVAGSPLRIPDSPVE